MYKLKLYYFDVNGGRGESARLALYCGGIEFEDYRFPFAELAAMKADLPYGSVPVLEVDGHLIAQSNAINRFAGRLAGLYPDDPVQALLCDEIMDAVEDATWPLVATFRIRDDEEKRIAREALVKGSLSYFLERIGRRLEDHGGEYFADRRLTVADLKVFVWVRNLRSGLLDHVPTDLVDKAAPGLAAHCERVGAHPKIVAYYAART